MLTYDVLIGLYLAYLGTVGSSGVLPWPVVALHILVGVLLVWTFANEQTSKLIKK